MSTRLIGRVDDDARLLDAFGAGGPLALDEPTPPGTWGLFEVHGGRARAVGDGGGRRRRRRSRNRRPDAQGPHPPL